MAAQDLDEVEARLQRVADRYPEDVALAPPELQACRTGRATWAFRSLDDDLAAGLEALLDRLLVRYRAEHA